MHIIQGVGVWRVRPDKWNIVRNRLPILNLRPTMEDANLTGQRLWGACVVGFKESRAPVGEHFAHVYANRARCDVHGGGAVCIRVNKTGTFCTWGDHRHTIGS